MYSGMLKPTTTRLVLMIALLVVASVNSQNTPKNKGIETTVKKDHKLLEKLASMPRLVEKLAHFVHFDESGSKEAKSLNSEEEVALERCRTRLHERNGLEHELDVAKGKLQVLNADLRRARKQLSDKVGLADLSSTPDIHRMLAPQGDASISFFTLPWLYPV